MNNNPLVKTIFNSFSNLYNYIHDSIKLHFEKKKAELLVIEKSKRDQYIYNFMRDLTYSLAVIYSGKRYLGLYEIYSPYHFRIINYREVNKNRLYIFSISKNYGNHYMTKEMLEELRENMNRDIISFKNDCIRMYGNEYIKSLYPEINGLYIVDVREYGYTDLYITVKTEYCPVL